MDTIAPMSGGAPSPSLDGIEHGARPLLWIALVLSVVGALSSRDLWAPDEPRYALVARTMLESGDWLVPRVDGHPYAEKPPLVFWAVAATGAVFGGLTPVVARLPCALLAALAVLCTARVARRWFGDVRLADTAALLFATTGLVLWSGSRVALDLPMTACALLALEAGTVFVARGGWGPCLACGAALGLGLLAKGPHVLYVPLTALAGGSLAAGAGRRLRDPRWLVTLSVAGALLAAWVVPAISAAGSAPAYNDAKSFGERLLGQVGSRLSGESEPHASGVFDLWPQLLAFALPWTPLWAVALWRWRRPWRAPTEDRFGLGAAIAGLLVPMVLLSLQSTKRDIYLLPLLPLAAILAAYAAHRLEGAFLGVQVTRIVAGVGGACALGAFAAPFLAHATFLPFDGPDRATVATLGKGAVPFALGAAGTLALIGSLACWAWSDRASSAVRALAIGIAAAWIVLVTAIVPAFDPWKSFRAAVAAADAAAPGAPLAIAGTKDASPLWAFHRDRLVETNPFSYEEAAERLAPAAPRILVLSKSKWWSERAKWTTWATPGTPKAVERLRVVRELDRARVLWERTIGGTGYVLLTNPSAP